VLVFETDARRTWTDGEVDLYRTFGDRIAYTVARNDRRLELRRRTQHLEQFSSVVSHDLRNPLNVLSGYLEMVESEVSASTYEPMDRAVTRMESLIDNLLVLAKRGEAIGEIESISVMSVADDGPGVPADVRGSLFDSGFSTADSSGIGLAVVDRIVEAHGWKVDVCNDGGAVFEVSFEAETAVTPE